MSRVCELTGKTMLYGNTVSHANNRARRTFRPNLVQTTLLSDALNQQFRFRVSANALRTVEHKGGLDAYLLGVRDSRLSEKARKIKKLVRKKTAASA
ncbi:MAG TPA: 50S ribosomal protein L28 [Sphingomonadales bacterium]|nr:50S ribosomal protein L28 [Sphingomonadales bacterium]